MILLHTIALEPARWTPARVSVPLVELLPVIAEAGFTEAEIYEPHLDHGDDAPGLRREMKKHGLNPAVLSSYLDLKPATMNDEAFLKGVERVTEYVRAYGFRKVRLFPSPATVPGEAGWEILSGRIRQIAERLPQTEIVLETHDGSVADNPGNMVKLVEELDLPNVGLLFQPTVFEAESTRRQFALQKPHIRHVHLQNRRKEDRGIFAPLDDGEVDWVQIITELKGRPVDYSIEFVPAGIRPVEKFNQAETVREIREAAAFVRALL